MKYFIVYAQEKYSHVTIENCGRILSYRRLEAVYHYIIDQQRKFCRQFKGNSDSSQWLQLQQLVSIRSCFISPEWQDYIIWSTNVNCLLIFVVFPAIYVLWFYFFPSGCLLVITLPSILILHALYSDLAAFIISPLYRILLAGACSGRILGRHPNRR
jgi:hypothetical protein